MSYLTANSLHASCKIITEAISKGKLNYALRLIHDFVERIITEPLCTGHVNGSQELDDLCQKIGECNFSVMTTENISIKPMLNNSPPVYVYIVTKLQKSGGHSRVIETLITARPDKQHVILSTELNGTSDFARLTGITNIVFEPSPKGNFQQRLQWLQRRLIEIRPEHTYLFNDYQDSVAIAAIQPKMSLNVSFYHHADHHLCLGVFLSHIKEHIDIHSMGYYHCREMLGINNVYLPLTVDDKGVRPTETLFKPNGYLTTCTAARANKIESPYFINYLELIPQLLKATGGKHIHIGRLTPWALFKLRRGLRKNGVASERFVYLPWVASVWNALHELGVDLYITSFPYGGGLTLIEAMGAGIPVAIHRHIYSRVISGIDLAYPNAFSWQNASELINYCETVTVENLMQMGDLARRQYEEFFHRDIFDALLSKKLKSTVPKLSEYSIKFDEWACWMESQLTLTNLFKRAAYRLFRRMRRMLS